MSFSKCDDCEALQDRMAEQARLHGRVDDKNHLCHKHAPRHAKKILKYQRAHRLEILFDSGDCATCGQPRSRPPAHGGLYGFYADGSPKICTFGHRDSKRIPEAIRRLFADSSAVQSVSTIAWFIRLIFWRGTLKHPKVVDRLVKDAIRAKIEGIVDGPAELQPHQTSAAHRDASRRYQRLARNKNGMWIARIRVGGKIIKLGEYQTVEAAAEAYNQSSLSTFGTLFGMTYIFSRDEYRKLLQETHRAQLVRSERG